MSMITTSRKENLYNHICKYIGFDMNGMNDYELQRKNQNL